MSSPRTNVKPPRIVAELGRPETPEETAARKAENSRAHRANQTTRNLILALIASLALVLFVVLIVVRPAKPLYDFHVNYHAVAKSAQPGISATLAAPNLPKTWIANDAELKSDSNHNTTWYLGLITPKQQFIAVEEGVKTDDTWLGALLGKEQPTGNTTIDGIRWTVYDRHATVTTGNFRYALYATIHTVKYVLHGTAGAAEFRTLASALEAQLSASGQG